MADDIRNAARAFLALCDEGTIVCYYPDDDDHRDPTDILRAAIGEPISTGNRKWGGRWYRVTHGCKRHEGHPIHECNGCQQATDNAITGVWR